MIALDASVVIAHLDEADARHLEATQFFRDAAEDQCVLHPLTKAEILVGPARAGRDEFALRQLDALHITEWMPPAGASLQLARLRAQTGLRLPDCCVLATAVTLAAAVATFDRQLRSCAAAMGIRVLPDAQS